MKSTTTLDSKRPVSKGPSYHHGDLRAALMEAALALIDLHGVKGFTLKDAARMAGVSTAAPYRHFVDKGALLSAIQQEGFRRFNAALAVGYEREGTARAKLIELGVAYMRFALENSAYFRVMFGFGGSGEGGDTGVSGFSLLQIGVSRMHPDANDGIRRDMVVACWSVVHGFALLQLDGAFVHTVGVTEPETQLRRTLRLMLKQEPMDCKQQIPVGNDRKKNKGNGKVKDKSKSKDKGRG